MRVAIYSRLLKEKDIPVLKRLLEVLSEKKIEISFYEPYYKEYVQNAVCINPLLFKTTSDLKQQEVDFLFSIGGDGTILDTLTLVKENTIPVIGINTGRLGFLASVHKEKIQQAVNALMSNNFVTEERSLLHLDSNIPLFDNVNYALNEFTIHRRDASSMIVVHAYMNGEFLNSYWADGLIIATPTGSTGYSLSCGGPIIFPNSGNFVITPVAPHNLNVRPLVVSDNSVLSFEISGRAKEFICTLDSRFEKIDSSIQLGIRKENFGLNLVRFQDKNFLSTIREKLAWGADKRN